MLQKLWCWQVVGWVSAFLLGGGIAFMLANHAWVADGFFIAGTLLLLSKFWTWEDTRQQTPKREAAIISITTVLSLSLLVGVCVWNHSINPSASKVPGNTELTSSQPPTKAVDPPTAATPAPVKPAITSAPTKPPKTIKEKAAASHSSSIPSPTPANGEVSGSDNTTYGNVPIRNINGSRNTFIGPTNGSNINIPPGTAAGYNAHADPSSVAIGSGAGAQQPIPPVVNYAPGGFATSGGTLVNPQVINTRPPPPQIVASVSIPIAAELPDSSPARRSLPRGADRPGASVTITLEGTFYNPAFVADCDTPCELVRAWDEYNYGETSVSTEYTPIGTRNRMAAGVAYKTSQMLPGSKIRLEFRSLSDAPLTVTNVRTYVSK